jgi:hypothetical protein
MSDFRIQFKSSHCSFYMWLNVSAIVWNEKLKAITIQKKRESEPLEFDHIEEIQSESAQNRDTWSRLSMPSETFD